MRKLTDNSTFLVEEGTFFIGDYMKTIKQIMDEVAIGRTLTRISHEIIESNSDLSSVCLVGIKTRGIPLANRIAERIELFENISVMVGQLDISLYRDDLEEISDMPKMSGIDIPFDINGKTIILIDDVIFTGRTVRCAIDALFTIGRPKKIKLVALIDRGHRELPIRPDYVGKNLPTSLSEVVSVSLNETDENEKVIIKQL